MTIQSQLSVLLSADSLYAAAYIHLQRGAIAQRVSIGCQSGTCCINDTGHGGCRHVIPAWAWCMLMHPAAGDCSAVMPLAQTAPTL